ncbi:MAG: hypothetical protein ACE5F4_01790 [Candidatus Paceibacteria bacterium]
MEWGSHVTRLGETTLKEKTVSFGINDADRLRHLCVLGRSGSGKAALMVQVALQDIERGIGTVFLDASGAGARLLIERLPAKFEEKVIYLDPANAEYPYSWNPLDDIKALPEAGRRKQLILLLVSLYHVAENPLVAHAADVMLARAGTTLITFHLLITDEKAREVFFKKDAKGKKAFEELLKAHPDVAKTLEEEGRYVGRDTLVKNLLGQAESRFSVTRAAEEGKVVIVDFSSIRMFPTRMNPIVRTFVAATAMQAAHGIRPVSLHLIDCLRYLDEPVIEHAFSAEALAVSLSDAVQQEADQERRSLAISRCGSIASFSTSTSDKAVIERTFYPYADAETLARLEKDEMIVAMAIDAVRARPFYAKALPLPPRGSISYQDLLVAARERYTTPRASVDRLFQAQKGGDKGDTPPGRRRGPGGFQDAFRSIMESRAKGMPFDTKKKQETGNKKQEKGHEGKDRGQETGDKKQEKKKQEVPEDVLKKLLYVQPIAS